MQIKTGIDIVYLPRFRKTLKRARSAFLQRVYLPGELENQQISHLAGIFAAKEAIIKTLSFPVGSWHEIRIANTKNGTPKAQISNPQLLITNHSLSISHDGNYVVAQFVALLK